MSTCASKQDVLELATLRYLVFTNVIGQLCDALFQEK